MQNFEVVRSMRDLPWLIPHEMDIFFDVFDVFDVFLSGVGVIETQVTVTLTGLRLHEVKTHSFAMSDVQVPVGLRRETGEDKISELVDPVLQQLFGVDCRAHLAADELRNVLNLENLFFSGNCFHFLHFLLLYHHVLWQSPGLPTLLEDVFQQLALDEGDLVPHFGQKLKFLGFLVGSSDLGLHDCAHLL